MVEAIGLLQYAVQGFCIFRSRHGHQGQSSARDTSLLYATRRLCSISSSKTRPRKQGSCKTIHQVGLGQSDPTDCRQRNNNEQHIAVLERQECIARAHRLARAPCGRKSATYSDGLSGPNSRPFVRSGVSQQIWPTPKVDSFTTAQNCSYSCRGKGPVLQHLFLRYPQ